MKNALKIIGIAILIAAVGFSMAACGDDEAEAITIIITGIAAGVYVDADIYLEDENDEWALGGVRNIGATATSITFKIFDADGETFNKAGKYNIYLDLIYDDGKEDRFYIMDKKIEEGKNSISFSSFSS